jgi:GAF domain-containing protein
MAEELIIAKGGKEEKYKLLYSQAAAVVEGENDVIANMANLSAMIHSTFGFWWTGFYRVMNGELILGPFQGPMACTRIGYRKGVCGTAWAEEQTIIVDDVDKFPGHIACSSLSRSEIVVPVYNGTTITAVLDIDSRELATFDTIDQVWLERIVQLL